MADSILFSFTKVDDFMETLIDTDDLKTSMFDGTTKNFRIVLVEACPANIEECLDENGCLNDEVTLINTDSEDGLCALLWQKSVNANRAISIASNSVSYDLNDETHLLKGAFLIVATGNASGTVLAYSINNAPMTVQKEIIFPVDGMLWSIYSQAYEGQL